MAKETRRVSSPKRRMDMEKDAFFNEEKECLNPRCKKRYRISENPDHPQGLLSYCYECAVEKYRAEVRKKHNLERKRLTPDNLSPFELEATDAAQALLTSYAATMAAYSKEGNDMLMTMRGPELDMPSHDVESDFTPYLKQLFLDLYVKMPRMKLFILEQMGITKRRYEMDLGRYP